ncbi:MAG: hypothetical protein H6636_13460 [Anaerolineales bacterium]|nr:hypothetical protein [Anaerolineales bacterium]
MPLLPLSYHLPSLAHLHLTGPDRFAFLQRQTTNDVTTLTRAAHAAVTTVLTSPTARILDVLQLYQEEETLHLLPLHSATYPYLRRRIFSNDHITLTDASADTLIVDLEGTTAGQWLSDQGLEPPVLEATTPGTLAGHPVRALGQPGLIGVSYRIIAPAGAPLLEHLQNSGIPPLTPEAYEIHRIEAGLPAAGHELTEDYTPHETNLDTWVSTTKGCYTGQEILARQVTYDKITRHLVGLKLDVPAHSGATVLAEDKPAGTITSAVLSPDFGPIALAILKRPYHEPGTPVTVQTESGSASAPIPARVTSLPFP